MKGGTRVANYRKNTDSDQRADELRHRVTFLHKQVTVQKGITKETWIPAFTCWAGAAPLSGREYFQAAAVNRETEIRFTIRFRKDVDSAMRLRYGGGDYNITAITDPQMRHVMLELLVKSVVPDGK
jgi:SPP1 family predicted phage head-tail adaptor